MALTLYTYLPNYRAWKTLIVALYNNVKINVPPFRLHVDNLLPEFLEKNPVGKVPVLETKEGCIFESNAIARYVARLRRDTGMHGRTFFEAALVDQWMDFSANELEPTRALWLLPLFGYMEFDEDAHEQAKGDMIRTLGVLNDHLKDNDYLVGDQITLADITVVVALVDLYRLVFAPEFRAPFPHLVRWIDHCTAQPHFKKVLGKVQPAKFEQKASKKGFSQSKASEETPRESEGTKTKTNSTPHNPRDR